MNQETPDIPAILYVTSKQGSFRSRRMVPAIKEWISKRLYVGKGVPFFFKHMKYPDLKEDPVLSRELTHGIDEKDLPIFLIEYQGEKIIKDFKTLKDFLDYIDLIKYKAYAKANSTVNADMPSM